MALRFKNQRAFNLEIERWATQLVPEQALLFQKKIAIDLLGLIIDKTPVGNPDLWAPASLPPPPGYVGGRARGNWQIRRTPTERTIDQPDPSGVVTVAAGGAALSAITKPFGVIFIFNNVKYINRLENGWSRQAPSGMVGLSLLEIESTLGRRR